MSLFRDKTLFQRLPLARESRVLWLGIILSAVTYMSSQPPMTQWMYADWVQFAAAVLAVVSAKLATSPLEGKDDK